MPEAVEFLTSLNGAKRDAALNADARQDARACDLALLYKLTTRQVQNILAAEKRPIWRKPQLDLFDFPKDLP